MKIKILDCKTYSRDEWIYKRSLNVTRRKFISGSSVCLGVALLPQLAAAQTYVEQIVQSSQLAEFSISGCEMSESYYSISTNYRAICAVSSSLDFGFEGSLYGGCWYNQISDWWGSGYADLKLEARQESTVEFSKECTQEGSSTFWALSKIDRASVQLEVRA